PHAASGWFCKHLVAVAIVWRDRLSGRTTPIDESARRKVASSAKRAQTIEKRWKDLEAFLLERKPPELAARLFELAVRESWIARELQQWREVESQSARPAEWKRLVTEIISTGHDFLDWEESSRYASRASAVLPLLRRARAHDAGEGAKLAIHALRRAWTAMESADDSNGEMGELCRAIGAEWVEAVRAGGEQPAEFGKTYLELLLADPFGCFDAKAVEEAMGSVARGRFERELASRWRRAKDAVLERRKADREADSKRPRTVRDASRAYRSREDEERALRPLERLHLDRLKKKGDVEGVLSVLREDLDTSDGYDAVTRFLEDHERFREAFTHAEEGARKFPDDWRLERNLLRCYERDGWHEEALRIRHRQFEQEPTVEHFRAAMKAAVAAGHDRDPFRSSLMEWLESLERSESERARQSVSYSLRPRGRGAPASEGPPRRNVSRRAAILCAEGRWQEACRAVAPPAACDFRTLGQIAVHLVESQAEDILSLGRRAIEGAMKQASSPYRAELTLVHAIGARLDASRRRAWMTELRTTYRAKRNFVAGLSGD
ncbi:hypothetical protein K2X89_00775, partial [Myxococcota bacterium]|nr:hypothetical protein [Myxococcota bacterium]